MAHLGVVYRFRVRELGKPGSPYRLLGSIDGNGTRLCDVGAGLLKRVDYRTPVEGLDDPKPFVTFNSELMIGVEHFVGAVFNHHEYGSRGVLHLREDGDEIAFDEEDSQQVQAVAVMSAKPMQTVGFIAVHVPNRRGIKKGLEVEMKRVLKEDYGLHLELTSVVPIEALQESIEKYGLGELVFKRMNDPVGLFSDDAERWADAEQLGDVEFRLTPHRQSRIPGKRLLRYLRGESSDEGGTEPMTFAELATVNDETYDEVRAKVFIKGREKTVVIDADQHSLSHVFNWDLGVSKGASVTALGEALVSIIPDE